MFGENKQNLHHPNNLKKKHEMMNIENKNSVPVLEVYRVYHSLSINYLDQVVSKLLQEALFAEHDFCRARSVG